MKVAVCFRGQLRTYKSTLDNLKRFFNTINNGDVTIDYFIHTWDNNLYFPTDSHKLSTIENEKYELANYDETFIKEKLNPKTFVIQDHKKYKENSTTTEHWGALFYSIYQANEFKKEYEKKNNFTYDLVISTRFDLLFPLKDSFPNFKLEDNTAYALGKHNLLNEQGFKNFDDMIFYGNSKSIDRVTEIYPNYIIPQLDIENYHKYVEINNNLNDIPIQYKLGPGSLLYTYMVENNIKQSCEHIVFFSVARKEVEITNLDGIKDYDQIRKLHFDFYKNYKFKIVKDNFATKIHCRNKDDKTTFKDLYHEPYEKGALDISLLKFTTYGNSEIEKIINVDSKIYKKEFTDRVFADKKITYIYPLMVAMHLPWHSSLETIPKKVLQACRENKLWILFENLLEGDTIPSIEWNSFHLTLQKLGIPPKNVIFTNNNFYINFEYEKWFRNQDNFKSKLRVIFLPYDILNIKNLISKGHLYEDIKFDNLFEFKSKNLDECKHFLKLNRTPRNERIAANIYLMENDILKNTKLSCTEYLWDNNNKIYDDLNWLTDENKSKFKNLLPLGISDNDIKNTGIIGLGDSFFDPNKPYEANAYLDTFISIVSTPFPTNKNEMHLHCSTYNPIYNMQPIIQYGPIGSLSTLKKLGFKTFDKWWSEDYDNIANHKLRLLEVLKIIKQVNQFSKSEILDIYFDMKSTLIHNYDLLRSFEAKFDMDRGIRIVSHGKYYT